ncbi:hypothetical protein IF1G_11260 [Cordyceps javanica]|uniref:Uncharacterized protein n=1 Tax=Cordyceps javanica TaxID=43265 RepID=A0A545VIN6_9HYPO|nr:hypothetical protein IF1G_11260 [Cordyceps javanica]TQW01585.1 hypothetical protein IF2G_10909 [Cordyceps javanica]
MVSGPPSSVSDSSALVCACHQPTVTASLEYLADTCVSHYIMIEKSGIEEFILNENVRCYLKM